jgi:S-adenosylmethionine synthetase
VLFTINPRQKGGKVISGLLTSIKETSLEALISKEPIKFVVKISVNSRCN